MKTAYDESHSGRKRRACHVRPRAGAELFLARCTYIARAQTGDYESRIYVSKDGMPVLLIRDFKTNTTVIPLPSFSDLQSLCEEQTWQVYHKELQIGDLMARNRCSVRQTETIAKELGRNLAENNCIVMIEK